MKHWDKFKKTCARAILRTLQKFAEEKNYKNRGL